MTRTFQDFGTLALATSASARAPCSDTVDHLMTAGEVGQICGISRSTEPLGNPSNPSCTAAFVSNDGFQDVPRKSIPPMPSTLLSLNSTYARRGSAR
jgi:hypothetical protein